MGTARFATLGLTKVRLEVAYGDEEGSVAHSMDVPPRTALLYPSPEAPSLAALAPEQRPDNLLVLDGTWAQSRALMRQNAWLQRLPCVRFTPPRESRYRVRREPRREYVSTLEAIQYALAELEPDVSLAPLIDAFERLMDDHLAQRRPGDAPRSRRPRQRRPRAVPPALVDHPERIAVVYLEPSLDGAHPGPRLPVQLCAERLSDGARFEAFASVEGQVPSSRHLQLMELSPGAFQEAEGVGAAVQALADFVSGHVSVGWNDTPRSLLEAAGCDLPGHVSLKAAYCNLRKGHAGSLESVLSAEGLEAPPGAFAGRAGQRMANARALLDLLLREAPPGDLRERRRGT